MVWVRVAEWLEVLGGSRPLPARYDTRTSIAVARGLWWLLPLIVVGAFGGRAVKFVYVDF